MAINPDAPLTLRALEDHLWESAHMFRNKISNQKDYILPLLFFKRASDRHHEETAEAYERIYKAQPKAPQEMADKIVKAQAKTFHTIQIPDGCFWEDVRNTDRNHIGEALNEALTAIGRANPEQLSGVFERIDFNNENSLPTEDLANILDHFHALGALTNDRITPDMLGQAYEWLIAKFAANAGKGGGEFYTPAQVGKLCARLLAPGERDEAYDPTCGSGGLLLQVRAEGRRLHGDTPVGVGLYGQELNPETWAIARMSMLLHGAGLAAEIERGDTLRDPKFREGGKLRKFKLIIANPPFSPKNWGHEWLKGEGDPWGRVTHVPPKSHGEMAFVQHMVASLTDDGRMAVVLPNGVFFRGKPGQGEYEVRKELVEKDLIEAIIQLPTDLFYGAGIPACILVLNKTKAKARKDAVILIDASECFERADTKNALRDSDIERVHEAFLSGEQSDAFSCVATTSEIADRQYNLGVARYVRGADTAEAVDVGKALTAYEAALLKFDETRLEASAILTDLTGADAWA